MSEDAREVIARFINEKYNLLISKVALEILENEDDAEDVKQEVLLKCSSKIETLKALKGKQLTSYVCTATKNLALNKLKERERREQLEKDYMEVMREEVLTMNQINLTAFQNQYGFSDEVEELLDMLSPIDKDIFVMKFYYCLTNEEIARELNSNVPHIKKRFQRAKKTLIQIMKERGGESHE